MSILGIATAALGGYMAGDTMKKNKEREEKMDALYSAYVTNLTPANTSPVQQSVNVLRFKNQDPNQQNMDQTTAVNLADPTRPSYGFNMGGLVYDVDMPMDRRMTWQKQNFKKNRETE